MKHLWRFGNPALLILLLWTAVGCVYYNTFYNALKRYEEAERKRRDAETRSSRQSKHAYMALYMSVIRKASIVLDRHPESKWMDDSLLIIGKAFYWREQYDESLLKFQELQENFPQSELIEESLYWQGLALWAAERIDEARGILETLVEASDPIFSPKARLALAELEAGEGNYDAAIDAYHHLLPQFKQKKLKAETRKGLGNAYFQLKRYDEALQAYENALASKPDPTTSYQIRLRIGHILELQRRFEEAMQVYQKILKIKRFRSYAPDIRLKQANVYLLMGRVEEALEGYQEVIRKNPRTEQSAEAYYRMGLIDQRQRKDLDRAKEHFEQARREKGNSEVSLLARDRLTDLADLRKYRKAAEADSMKNPEPLFNLAELYLFNLADPDTALAIYQKVLEVADTTEYAPKSLYAIGLIYADSLKDEQAAQKTFRKLIDAYPASSYAVAAQERTRQTRTDDALAEARFLEAEALARGGTGVAEVLTILEQVTETYPKSLFAPKALYTLAWTYENRLDSIELARAHYQRLIDRYPLTAFSEVAREKLEKGFVDPTATDGADSVQAAESVRPDSDVALQDTLSDTAPDDLSSQGEEADLVAFWEVETKPVMIKHVDAQYPEEARFENAEGEVFLRFRIGKEGWVEEVEVLKGDEVFRQAAIDAVKQFMFEPATQNDQPVRVWVPYAIEFKLSSEAARAEEDLVDFWKVEKKPVLVERVAPEYPEEAQWENLEGGEVLVRFQVGKDGRVEQVEVLEGEKVFRQAAIDAVRQFVFEPAMHDFRPVRVWVIESIKFKVPD